MQKAKELLHSGKYNVNETAQAIGYHNTSNFILTSKKLFAISPGELTAQRLLYGRRLITHLCRK